MSPTGITMVRKIILSALAACLVSVSEVVSFNVLVEELQLADGRYLREAGLLGPLLAVQAVMAFIATMLVQLLGGEVQKPARTAGTVVEEDVEDGRERGVVKWFNVKKGFGFITWDSGEDVFVHFRSIRGQGHRSLAEGQRVKFSVVRGDKGPQAEDVSAVR
jgi:cold shock protein